MQPGILGHATSGVSIAYDLRTKMSDVPGQPVTFPDATVLDTAAEGVLDGSLTVVETGAGTVKATGDVLEIVGTASWAETGVVSPASTRGLGLSLFGTRNKTAGQNEFQGWSTTSGLLHPLPDVLGLTFNGTTLYGVNTSVVSDIGVIAGSTEYQTLALLGGYDSNGIAFAIGDTVADFKYGGAMFIKGGDFTDWTCVYRFSGLNTTPMYHNIAGFNSTTLYSNILIPTAVLDVDTMFQPNFLDTFTGTNNDQLVSDHTPEVVAGAAGTGNPWESGSTTWTIQSNTANNDPGSTNVYTSDYSVDTDGAVIRDGISDLSGNIDGIAGEDNVLRTTLDASDGIHRIEIPTYPDVLTYARLRFDYYIPSSNSVVDGITVTNGVGGQDFTGILNTLDSWTSVDVLMYIDSGNGDGAQVFARDGSASSFQDVGGDDVFYLKNWVVDVFDEDELIATDDLAITEGIFDINLTIPAAENLSAGIILAVDDKDTPANKIRVTYNRLEGKVQVEKVVAGTSTSLINTTATYGAGNQLRAILYEDGSDLKLRVYYNGALIGSEQTVSDAGIVGNTRHGIMSVDSSNSLDNFTVHRRTDSSWDTEIAAATGGTY